MQLFTLNISLDAISLFLCLYGILVSTVSRKVDNKTNKIFIFMLACHFFSVLCNMLGLIYKGNISNFGRVIIPIVNFGEFLFTAIFGFLLSYYFIFRISEHKEIKPIYKIMMFVFPALTVLLLIINIPTNIIYFIDAANIYHRGNMYYLFFITALGTVLFNIFISQKNIKLFSKQDKFSIWVFFFVSIVAVILQNLFYGIYFISIGTTLYLIVMLSVNWYDTLNDYYSKKEEVFDMQAKIMFSQIQPHFLYNSLTSIMAICDESPKAKKAIADFSKYLRGNLDSLSYSYPIPFEKEIRHVQTYLRLEKLRFEDNIETEYIISATNFNIPSLSVQILVENAIKHGITHSMSKGKVSILTRETENNFEIVVQDDGIGFDANAVLSDDRLHIGLTNLKNRLQVMCKGSLQIDSAIGKGTTATITIPKNEKNVSQ